MRLRFSGVCKRSGFPRRALSPDLAGQGWLRTLTAFWGLSPVALRETGVTSFLSGRVVQAQGDLVGDGAGREGGCWVGAVLGDMGGVLELRSHWGALSTQTFRGGEQTRSAVVPGKTCFHFCFLLACGWAGTGGWEPDFCPWWGTAPEAVLRCKVTLFCTFSEQTLMFTGLCK